MDIAQDALLLSTGSGEAISPAHDDHGGEYRDIYCDEETLYEVAPEFFYLSVGNTQMTVVVAVKAIGHLLSCDRVRVVTIDDNAE
jgi:hypothetical protein